MNILTFLAGAILMTKVDPHQSLQMDLSEPTMGTIAVSLIANSNETQRVSYELRTTGASVSIHKGATRLQANQIATLSTVQFSAGDNWCVSLSVEEEMGAIYNVTRGNACGNDKGLSPAGLTGGLD
jgi:hypothetical protein